MGTAVASVPFTIDTSRNGKGPLDPAPYGAAPYNQPQSVLAGLTSGNWCNAPSSGLGLRPTSTTGVPLVDALLWVKTPGESDGSCDIAGGARAWDYSLYNSWGIVGDAQNHFDPLFGMVDPIAGGWFSEMALKLAKNANPPLF
jgi:endoglucanase